MEIDAGYHQYRGGDDDSDSDHLSQQSRLPSVAQPDHGLSQMNAEMSTPSSQQALQRAQQQQMQIMSKFSFGKASIAGTE